jgi:hypothetical protein
MRAVNSHAAAVLDGWTPAPEGLRLKGRNVKRVPSVSESSDSNSVKFGEVSGEEVRM